MMDANKFVTKLDFRENQIQAIKSLFNKYIASVCQDFQYIGYAMSLTWNKFDLNLPAVSRHDGAFLPGEKIYEYDFNQMRKDPLWQEFSDILPYMSQSASLTVMPPMSMMPPHVDRPSRPPAIYFPISDPDPNCISDFYDLPKNNDKTARNVTQKVVMPIFSHSMMDGVFLMNPQEWHGVRSFSTKTRIVLGWNTAYQQQRSYKELVEIFRKLGYCK